VDGRVVVIGSINIDVITRSRHLPTPGETLIGADLELATGGKGANQAVAAGRLGAKTSLTAAVGTDMFAHEVLQFLSAEAIDLNITTKAGVRTGLAQVLVAEDGENAVVVASGANAQLTVDDVTPILIRNRDVVLLQNEIPPATSDFIVEKARSCDATVVLNLAPYRLVEQDVLAAVDCLIALSEWRGPSRNLIVTLGSYGVIANLNETIHYVGGYVVPVRDTTGAGDCFCGALAAALTAGFAAVEALTFANAAAAMSVGTSGTTVAMPYLDDCHRLLHREGRHQRMRELTF